jgi:hypothetical protein
VDQPGDVAHERQLEVLQMPAGDMGGRVHELALFLDWLADAVLLGSGGAAPDQAGTAAELPAGLFLAPDVRVSGVGASDGLRAALLDRVAAVVEEACGVGRRPALGPQEARHVARVLRFLGEQGWRPAEASGRTAGARLAQFWERLAECVGDAAERDRCRALAWRFAERQEDVRRLGALLGH